MTEALGAHDRRGRVLFEVATGLVRRYAPSSETGSSQISWADPALRHVREIAERLREAAEESVHRFIGQFGFAAAN